MHLFEKLKARPTFAKARPDDYSVTRATTIYILLPEEDRKVRHRLQEFGRERFVRSSKLHQFRKWTYVLFFQCPNQKYKFYRELHLLRREQVQFLPYHTDFF